MIIFLILVISSLNLAAAQEDGCQPASCHPSGPIIRFPFRLLDRQPERCGYPGFDLSCNSNYTTSNDSTIFDFQFPVRASARNIILPISARATVQEIDYGAQVIRLSVLNGSCLPARVPAVSATPSPFQMFYQYSYQEGGGYTIFNCSGRPAGIDSSLLYTCLTDGPYQVYTYPSLSDFNRISFSNCVKIYNISDISSVLLKGPGSYGIDDSTLLHWPEPSCGDCESRGGICRLRNGTRNQTQCIETSVQPPPHTKKGVSKNVLIVVVVVGAFLMVLVTGVLYRVYIVKKRERRIEQFLEDYKALRPTRYTYAEVKRITDGFKYRLGQGGYGTVFKGKLLNEIMVAVKVLNNVKGNGEEFINEVGTIGQIHHVNVVRLVGYCADGYRRALVYEFLENDSLEKYISLRNPGRKLGWEKLHEIAIGIAKGLDYLHQGCNQRILHFDIKPQNILLDRNLNPKVADFGLAKLCSREKSVVTMTAARGTIGYIAPEVFSRNFGNVSYKSDIYSFGMLLLDMVGGRKAFDSRDEESSEFYFPEWMYNQLDKGMEISIEIENEEENEIVKRLIIVGLWCIQWYPVDRPSAKVVIQMLEGDKMPIMPPNPFTGSNSGSISADKSSSTFSSFI